ncbi:hypothetical protein ACFPM0_19810 [Pseudonocardia sulfidoxydans]|uniref:hypothetical protein n=1 Tax=Pseudonocardia sulfidoxydans TaxID=54011 RepID=UPI0036166B4C
MARFYPRRRNPAGVSALPARVIAIPGARATNPAPIRQDRRSPGRPWVIVDVGTSAAGSAPRYLSPQAQ